MSDPWQSDTPGTSKSDPLPATPPSGHVFPRSELCVLRHRKPVQAEAGLRVCMSHLTGLSDMLVEAVSLFGDLDELAVPGPSTEEHVRGKPVASKPPFRLEVMVVRDATLTEIVDDTVPVGVLARWARQVGEERVLQRLNPRDADAALARLRLHLRWVVAAEWVPSFEKDLRRFVACLRRLAGDRPRPRVGVCQVVSDEVEGECGGPLLADRYGGMGVTCARCGDRWNEDELRRLGLILAAGGAS